MGVIQTIHMDNRGVFEEGKSSFESCAIANFVYGPNGSGKSTISNFLRSQNGLPVQSSDLVWEGEASEIVVYNKEWREENFRDQQNLPGVFTLGSDSVDAQKKLEELEEKLRKTKEKIESAKRQIEDKSQSINLENEAFRNSVWDNIFKPSDESLGLALSGYRASKIKFADKLITVPEIDPSIPMSSLVSQVASVFAGNPTKYEAIDASSFRALIDALQSCESNEVWQLAITGNQDVDIAALINALGSSDWVRQGMSYINSSNVCPFCQKPTIDQDLTSQLESFFDSQYETRIRAVRTLSEGYSEAATKLLSSIEELSSCQIVVSGEQSPRDTIDKLSLDLKTHIESSAKSMKIKGQEPSRRLSIPSGTDLFHELIQVIDSINDSIEKHNLAMDDLAKEKERLTCEVWATLRKQAAAAIQTHSKTIKGLESAKRGLEKTVREQEAFERGFLEEITEVRKGITSIQPTVDQINNSLASYGFDGFSIQPSHVSENSYQIVRANGTPAGNTLSEGEETFVAFLYFMQLIEGSIDPEHFSQEKVVVIDDPICSLDSTVLYIVSCMVKQLIDNAKQGKGGVRQVFVLTHNAFFHKEASFSKGKAREDNDTKYWVIQKHGSSSSVKDYDKKNPIKTSYELLWEEIKDESASTIALQNSMRRIVENYFRMLGGNKSVILEDKFETIEEKIICRSLFAWMNDGSHSIPDDLYIDSYSESPDKYKQVFRQVFEKSGNGEHYKMMMGEIDQ